MRFIITFILLLLSQKGDSQTSWQMPFDSTSRWKTGCLWSFNGGLCVDQETYEYYIGGDTTANNYTYKKLFYNYVHSQNVFNCPVSPCTCCVYACNPAIQTNVYDGGLRGNSKKIYLLPPSQLTDTLLYDFDLSLGDTLPPSYIHDTSKTDGLRVTRIDTLLIGNQYRKRFTLSSFSSGCFFLILPG